MSLASVARAAVATFPDDAIDTPQGAYPLPVVMVAIAGAETGGTWADDTAGDCDFSGPSCGQCSFGGSGATSWGAWQIHNSHATYLEQVTGSSDPCSWARWLFVPSNCAQAALAVLGSDPQAGLSNWSTWGRGYGHYLEFIGQAVDAVEAARSPGTQPPAAGQSAPVQPGTSILLTAGVAAAGVGAIALLGQQLGWWDLRGIVRRVLRR